MKTCDFVITNPPFRADLFQPLADFLIQNNIGYILFCGLGPVIHYVNNTYFWIPPKITVDYFMRPDGTAKKVLFYIMTSFKPPMEHYKIDSYLNREVIPPTAIPTFCKDDYYLARDREYDFEHRTFCRFRVYKK